MIHITMLSVAKRIGTSLKAKKGIWITLLMVVVSLVSGMLVTYKGIHGIDDVLRYRNSRFVVDDRYNLVDLKGQKNRITSNVPFALVSGVASEIVFPWVKDPYWIRHALTFALYVFSLFLSFIFIRKAGYPKETAFLGVAVLYSIIRFGGHSMFNVKDGVYACVYLIVTLASWHLIRRVIEKVSKGRVPWATLCLAGAVGIWPWLTRTPDISHFVITAAICGWIGLYAKQLKFWQRALLGLVVCISAYACAYALSPSLWEMSPVEKWTRSYKVMSNFRLRVTQVVYGYKFSSLNIPRWYAFAWIPIIINPLGLLTSAAGMCCLFFRRSKQNLKAITIPLPKKIHITISLQLWIWIFVFITWMAVIIINPNNHADERHILFIYPILFLAGTLGLSHIKKKYQLFLASALIVVSTISYIGWEEYSYVYRSPLVSAFSESDFMGEYRALCFSDALLENYNNVPKNTRMSIYGWPSVAKIQDARMRHSAVFKKEGFEGFSYGSCKKDRPCLRIAHNRYGKPRKIRNQALKDVESGSGILLWERPFPTGEKACIAVFYPNGN